VSLSILIVDDSDMARAVIRRLLALSELAVGEVHEARDGEEALGVLAAHWIDVVFADLAMPRMSGVELIERMAADELWRRLPVIVVSADHSASRRSQLTQQGVRAFVTKPFRPRPCGRWCSTCSPTPKGRRHELRRLAGAAGAKWRTEVLGDAAFFAAEPVAHNDAASPERRALVSVRCAAHLSLAHRRVGAVHRRARRQPARRRRRRPRGATLRRGCLGELANVLAAAVVRAACGATSLLDIGVPDKSGAAPSEPALCRVTLLVDERHRLEVALLAPE